MRLDGTVEVPTGSLFPDGFVESTSETRDLHDTFPLTQTGTEGNGMGSLRSLWKQVRKMLYADPDGPTWFGANVKDAVDKPDAIAKFEVALYALQDWMRTMGRTVPMVEQWNLVSEQQELHTIASNLLDDNLIGGDVYTLGAADRLLTVIIKLMDSLVPPWLEDSTQPLPLPTAGKQGEFTPSQTEQLKNHFVSEYGKIKSRADEFVAVIRFITQTTQLPGLDERLVYLAGRIEAMSSVVVVVEEQNRRMQRIWHVQRDTLYQKGLPGDPFYITHQNAGQGSCGYHSFVASVGLDGITSNPALGYPASRKADPNYKGKITDSVRNKAADWLLGGASKDMTNWQYSKMMSVRQAMLHVDGNGAILVPLTEAQKVTNWKRKVTQRRRLTYWAAESDWTAIAAVFKRRIHLYNIINQDGREEGDDYIIKYCKYHDSYGHIEHRPVCIASTYGGQYKRGLDLVASVRVGQDLDRDHYCAILNTVTNPGGPTCVPWAGGYSEVDLPYEDDLVDPFGLYTSGAPPQRPTPPTDCPRPPPDFMQQFIAAYYVREKTEAHTTENARWDVQKEREATAKDNAEKEGATETEVGAYTAAKKETEKRKKEAQDAEAEMKAAEAVLVESFPPPPPQPPPQPPPPPPPVTSAEDHDKQLKMLQKAARERKAREKAAREKAALEKEAREKEAREKEAREKKAQGSYEQLFATLSSMTIEPYGVMGWQMGEADRIGKAPNNSIVFVDPAGLPYIESGLTAGAGSASGAIYKEMKLKAFPEDVREKVIEEGEAVYHKYDTKDRPTYNVIHAVGPNFEEDYADWAPATHMTQAIEKLAIAYSNVFVEFAGCPLAEEVQNPDHDLYLRLLPISGGVFAGAFRDVIGNLTMRGILAGIRLLPAVYQRFLAMPNVHTELCIYDPKEFETFKAAKVQMTGAGDGDGDADKDDDGGGGGVIQPGSNGSNPNQGDADKDDGGGGGDVIQPGSNGSNPNQGDAKGDHDPPILGGVIIPGRTKHKTKSKPDPNHDGCGEGRTPVNPNQSNGQRYNYVDHYLTGYQKLFIDAKMKEAHDAFIQHVSNRQNYSTIMLMRNIDEDPSQASNTTYKGKTKANSNRSQERVQELYGPLAAANPTHTEDIWDGWKAWVKGNAIAQTTAKPDNVLRKMLGRLFALKSFSQPDPKNFWTTLCVWWVTYKGTRAYPKSNEDVSSDGKRLQHKILTWHVDWLGRKEKKKDGSDIKLIWSFLDAAVETLTELDGPEATLLDAAEPSPVPEAMEDFVMRTQGNPNQQVRMNLLWNQAVVKALIALMRNKLNADRVSNDQDADDQSTDDLNDQVVAADRAVYAVSALLQKESPRAPIEELNDEILALDAVALPLRNMWFEERYPERGNDVPTLKDLLEYHLALSRCLLIHGGGLQHPDYHHAVAYWVAQADVALAITASLRPISIELLRKLIYSLFSANTELFTAFSPVSGPIDPKRQADFHQHQYEISEQNRKREKAAEDAKKVDDDAAEEAAEAAKAAEAAATKEMEEAEAAAEDARIDAKKEATKAAKTQKAQERIATALQKAEAREAAAEKKREALHQLKERTEADKIRRHDEAIAKKKAAEDAIAVAWLEQKKKDEEIWKASHTQAQIAERARKEAAENKRKKKAYEKAQKDAEADAERRAKKMDASEKSEQFGTAEIALNDLHEQAKAILREVGSKKGTGPGGYTEINNTLRKLVKEIDKERGHPEPDLQPGRKPYAAIRQTWGMAPAYWTKKSQELFDAVQAYKDPENGDELLNAAKVDADKVRDNRVEANRQEKEDAEQAAELTSALEDALDSDDEDDDEGDDDDWDEPWSAN